MTKFRLSLCDLIDGCIDTNLTIHELPITIVDNMEKPVLFYVNEFISAVDRCIKQSYEPSVAYGLKLDEARLMVTNCEYNPGSMTQTMAEHYRKYLSILNMLDVIYHNSLDIYDFQLYMLIRGKTLQEGIDILLGVYCNLLVCNTKVFKQ